MAHALLGRLEVSIIYQAAPYSSRMCCVSPPTAVQREANHGLIYFSPHRQTLMLINGN